MVGPNSDAHVYAPAPADAKKVADAKVVFVNGLGFEGWMSRLVKASGSKAPLVVATKGVKARASARAATAMRGRSACLAVGRQRQDLRRQYPRRAGRGRSGRQGRLRGERRRLSRQARRARRGRARRRSPAFRPTGARSSPRTMPSAISSRPTASTSSRRKASRPKPRPRPRTSPRIITQVKKQKVPGGLPREHHRPAADGADRAGNRRPVGGKLYSDALTDAKGDAPPISS